MVESIVIIIGCYLLSAVMVHAVYGWFPRLRRSVQHYIVVTKNNEQQAELILRAISWYSWLRGKDMKITFIDEGSEDLTVPIIQRLRADQVHVLRSKNWIETERLVRNFKQTAKVAGYRIGADDRSGARLSRSTDDEEKITIIYMNRQEDRAKIPLFHF